MLLHKVLRQVVEIAQPIVKKLETQVKAWTKPATDSLLGGTAVDLVKSFHELRSPWGMKMGRLREQTPQVDTLPGP
jgi:hypothetical protein